MSHIHHNIMQIVYLFNNKFILIKQICWNDSNNNNKIKMKRKLIKYFFLFSFTTIIVHFLLTKKNINELYSKFMLNILLIIILKNILKVLLQNS